MPIYTAMVRGWNITAREAYWRCCATESAISFRAAILSDSLVKVVVVRGGMSARGSAGGGRSSAVDIVARLEVGKESGGRVCEDEASRRGVEEVEFRVEVGRTRFARRKVKNAV